MTIELRAHEVNNTSVRKAERASIREFVTSCSEHLAGHVLDYGCGLQPYRDIVEAAGGTYEGFDRAAFPANVSLEDVGREGFREGGLRWDAILCNQVLQYVPSYDDRYHETGGPLWDVLRGFHTWLSPTYAEPQHPRHLILTYPTTWAEVETEDLQRFTRAGMDGLLTGTGFTIVRHEQRAAINLGGFRLPLGYGVLARV